jgi:heterodisulfide reductase subunit A
MAGMALVIGGGAAGLQAAWGLLNSGCGVVLVEKSSDLGGTLSHDKYLFPMREEAFKLLGQRYSELVKSPDFRLLLNSELRAFNRNGGAFDATIIQHPAYVDRPKCDGCGECVAICPAEVADGESKGLARRKAVHRRDGIPGGYLIDRELCPAGCALCAGRCPAGAINLDARPRELKERFGAVIVATGMVPYDLAALSELGYGRSPDILTGLEFEILFGPRGPTKGDILRPSDGKRPGTVAILTCVGSRDEKHRPYCCQVGCMNALNQAYTVKERLGDGAEVYVCFTDVRAHGKYYEEFYKKVRGMQVKFIRGKPSEVMVDYDQSLGFDIFDTATHKLLKLRPDLIVLEPALVNGAPQLAKILGVELDREGFFSVDSEYSMPVNSSAAGIFIAGTASGPKDVVGAMANASAAALAASRFISATH